MDKSKIDFINKVRMHWFLCHVFADDVCTFIGAQFALESAFGTSEIALLNNNFCGMKKPQKRCSKSLSLTNRGFSMFKSFDDCIIDYCLWVFYNRPKSSDLFTAKSYAKWLSSSGYCPDSDYVSKICRIFNSYQNECCKETIDFGQSL